MFILTGESIVNRPTEGTILDRVDNQNAGFACHWRNSTIAFIGFGGQSLNAISIHSVRECRDRQQGSR